MIKSWPTLECYLPSPADLALSLRHTGSRSRETDAGAQHQGETVWLGELDGSPVGLAWEWAELRPGVVMMADPNSLVTNLRFVDDGQCAVAPLSVLVALNRIVHGLPWQRAVCEMLRAERQSAVPATPPGEAGARVVAVPPVATPLRRPRPLAVTAGPRPEAAATTPRRPGTHPGERRGDPHFAREDRRAA